MRPLEATYVPWAELAALRSAFGEPPPAFPGLYVCGSLAGLERPTVAVVGTRAASSAGKQLARTVARDLGQAGVCTISGLALGIDAAAHQGALEAPAPTIGILGGGHHRFFPMRNHELAERMLQAGGAVLSPFAPDEDTFPSRFLERNSAVAALADAVVVIEAPQRSGALNTAGWAAGRIPVLVFPGDVDRRNVAGCLALIRDGATLVRDAADIVQELRLNTETASAQMPLFEPGTEVQRRILRVLEIEPMPADQLLERCDASAPQILAALTELELSGVIQRREGGVFARS